VKLGAYHTLELEPQRAFTLAKARARPPGRASLSPPHAWSQHCDFQPCLLVVDFYQLFFVLIWYLQPDARASSAELCSPALSRA